MADITPIKYLGESGLKLLWDKISNTFLRDSEVLEALTTFGDGKIITTEDGVFIQKKTLDDKVLELNEKINTVASKQPEIDGDTIINVDGKLQTDILLHNDKNTHTLSIVTGGGTVVSRWDYTDFYNEAVKDGILDEVSLVKINEGESEEKPGTYLKFVFNTSSGKTPLYVNVTELIDEYKGSTYIDVVKNGAESVISLKTTELVEYLKSDEALGISGIITKLDLFEEDLNAVKELLADIEEAWKGLEELKAQVKLNTSSISDIYEYLKSVPNTPITDSEIYDLQ